MLSLRPIAAILLCLGPIPGLAQNNPWRVPGYGGGEAWQSSAPRSDSWNGGYTPGSAQPYQGGGYGSRRPEADAQAYPREGWNSSRDARQPTGNDQQAAVGRPGAGGYGATSSAPYWNQSQGRNGYPDTNGNYANPGYTMPSTVQPPYLYGRQFGEFPPPEGKERTPGAESLPSQAPPARQAPGASGYGAPPNQQTAPPAYGYGSPPARQAPGASGYGAPPSQQTAPPAYGYGSGYGTPLGGPSTLTSPWGVPGNSIYGIPYGIGVPGPYGW